MKKEQHYSETGSTVGVSWTTRPIHYKVHINTTISTGKLLMTETDSVHPSFRQEVLLKLSIMDICTAFLEYSRQMIRLLKGALMKSAFTQSGWKRAIKHLLLWWVELWAWWKESSALRVITFSFINHAFRWRGVRSGSRAQKPNGEIIALIIITIFNPRGWNIKT